MDKVERYVYAVGLHVPRSGKEDILKEIHSIILDMLEERTVANKPDEKIIDEVLLALGEPRELALKYRNQASYVIGPALYDTYILVLKIVLIAVAIGIGVATGIGMIAEVSATYRYSQFITKIAGSLFQAGIGAFGMVTLIFFLIERYGFIETGKRIQTKSKPVWHPSKLDPIPQSFEVIKRSEVIGSLVFTLLALVLFNFYADRVGIYEFNEAGRGGVLSLFALERLAEYMIFLNILWIMTIVTGGYQLRMKRHTLLSSSTEFVISAASLVLLLFMLQDSTLLNLSTITEMMEYSDGGAKLVQIMRMSWRVAIVATVLIIGYDLVKKGILIWKCAR